MFSKSLNGLSGRAAMRFLGKDEILSRIAEHGQAAVAAALGMANPGVLSVALANLGWRETGTGTPRGPRKTRIQGCLPIKTAIAIMRAIGLDPELDDPSEIGWEQYKVAYEKMGESWLNLLISRLGGNDSQAAKDFQLWIDSNIAADLSAAEEEARKADPLFQLKEQISGLKKTVKEKNERIAELESEVQKARSMSGPKRYSGGNLTVEMKRLMQQRFHPDKQNGNSVELYTAVTQFINSLETVD